MRSARVTKSTAGPRKGRELDPMLASVASIMSRKVQSVRPDTSLEAAMELLLWKDISHLPVVDEGALVGLVSKTDVVREHFLSGSNEEHETVKPAGRRGAASFAHGFHEEDSGRMVSDLMSTKVRTVTPAATIAEAAISMTKYRVHGLPVVNAEGALVGFVSTLDVVRWVAQSLE